MPIGSSHEYPAHRAAHLARALATPVPASPWSARFPNPADICFNYRKLLDQPGGIGNAAKPNLKIAIVGAGMTGLSAAREAYRSGFRNITVFEASNTIGGRHRTVTDVAGQGLGTEYCPLEMGAMRMPLFNVAGQEPKDGMSLLAYYATMFCLSHEYFPNPGSKYVNGTGVYLQEGILDSKEPTLSIWENFDGDTPPPGALARSVYDKWNVFSKRMTDVVSSKYGSVEWEPLWAAMVQFYENIAFRDLVQMKAIEAWSKDKPGNFGGIGFTQAESDVFYSIGFGDGSWGAFYDLGALWPIRIAIMGYASQLQLFHGRYTSDGTFNPGPYADKLTLKDSAGNTFDGPKYRGIRCLDDCMLFLPVPETQQSFYDFCMQAKTSRLMMSHSVVGLDKQPSGQIRVRYDNTQASTTAEEDFDAVLVTVPSWIMELTMPLTGFTKEMMPTEVVRAYKRAHWGPSVKVFAPLKPEFFDQKKIPQILVTDTFLHDVYAYKYGVGDYKFPCICMSYTWEDDSEKFASMRDDAAVVDKIVDELDRLLMRSTNVQERISPYILKEHSVVQRWSEDGYAKGCAHFYRSGGYADAVRLTSYTSRYSEKSGLYLAGEAYSPDGGWTEPCFRGAADTVIHLLKNTGSTYNGGFTLADYPKVYVPE